jgi:hypothetical protein
MVDIQKLKPSWHDHRTDIPRWLLAGIGQVASEWAVCERELEELIRLLMDVRIEFGRIIVNWMNAKTRVATAQHLIQLHILDGKLKKKDHLEVFTKIAEKIESLQTKRDILAHGTWDEYQGVWCTLKMRQSRKTPQLEPDLDKLGRAVLPQRDPITRERLKTDAKEIADVTKRVVAFCSTLETALAPLQNKSPEYTRRRRGYRLVPTRQAHSPPRKSQRA